MRRRVPPGNRSLGAAVLLLLLLVGCAAAPPPGLVVTDELRVLDESRCRRAAQGLTGQGATVALFLVEEGEVWSRLREAGLTRGTRLHPHVMVVYASRDPRYSELRVGSNFSEALPRPTLERLRTGVLNPALAAGSYEQGFEDTLQALEVELARGRDTMATGRLWALGALAGLGLGWIALLVLRAAWDRHPDAWVVRTWRGFYARTPPGRREEARREAARREAREQARADARAAWERSSLRPPDLSPETEDLARFRAALADLSDVRAGLARAAADAAKTLAGAKAAFRAARGKKWRQSRPEARARLHELKERLAALEAERSALDGLEHRPLLDRMAALRREFASVDAELRELWDTLGPRPPAPLRWTTTSASAPEPPPREAESSWSGPSLDYDASPGDSRAGGDW